MMIGLQTNDSPSKRNNGSREPPSYPMLLQHSPSTRKQHNETRTSDLNIRENSDMRYLRSTFNDSLHTMSSGTMYRSNSNLELHDCVSVVQCNPSAPLKRVSSHGSIDIIADKTHDALAKRLLQEYNVKGMDKRILESNSDYKKTETNDQSDSPKLNIKLKLWNQVKNVTAKNQNSAHEEPKEINSSNTVSIVSTSADIEERARRRAFAHFDCQSLVANLGYAARLRDLLLSRRRNTTTGASAAAMYSTRCSTPDADDDDKIDKRTSNDLVEACPFFRNEVGGEMERHVGLSRVHFTSLNNGNLTKEEFHRPSLSYGVSILECPFGETLWKKHSCPYEQKSLLIEEIDKGAYYYRQYFSGQEHQNWFGMEEQLGPVAISIKKEKPVHQPLTADPTHMQHLYRIIVRTSELLTLRGSIFEDSIPRPRGKPVATKDILDYVAPEIQSTCLRLAMNTSQCEQQLLKLDEQGISNKYKVGILYCREGQQTEEEMYNNMDGGGAFMEFLESIGKIVRLKGFQNYKAGLDTKTDSTGTHSVYATYSNCEVMFHVSTMLPFTPNNRQQLLRKRHIGNDIVTIIFQEPGAKPFTPKNIRSQFQHVFIIVRVISSGNENTLYHVAVSRSKEVSIFGPPLKKNAIYAKGKKFTEFLLAKIINAENAAHRSKKFATMATRTRQEYLKDLSTNYITQIPVETGQKFSLFPSRKKDIFIPRFNGDACQRGAFCWQVVLDDSSLSAQVDCFLGISSESFVLIEEGTHQIIFVIPNRSILGWSTSGNALRVYYHQGECITINMHDVRERDEQLEVIERLRAVSFGTGALELNLNRNSLGQLGFHLQPDGVVTTVEINGPAWTAGLRQGYRLVEICKIAIATLSHDQMVDLLKTSVQVTVTVIESLSDFSPRRGCLLQNCKFNAINYEHDFAYSTPTRSKQGQNENNTATYSSVSSGYETATNYRTLFTANDLLNRKYPSADMHGTLTSSSSGHSSSEDKWFGFDSTDVHNKRDASTSRAYTRKNPNMNSSEVNFKTPSNEMLAEPFMAKPSYSNDQLFHNADNIQRSQSKPYNDERPHASNKIFNELEGASTSSMNDAKKPTTPLNEAHRRHLSMKAPSSHRHSTHGHYTGSVQENLLKLICPDYEAESSENNLHHNEHMKIKKQRSSGNLFLPTTSSSKLCDYDENNRIMQNRLDKDLTLESFEGLNLKDSSTIVTTARPATIISSTKYSPNEINNEGSTSGQHVTNNEVQHSSELNSNSMNQVNIKPFSIYRFKNLIQF